VKMHEGQLSLAFDLPKQSDREGAAKKDVFGAAMGRALVSFRLEVSRLN
jgi:hypothetical protein